MTGCQSRMAAEVAVLRSYVAANSAEAAISQRSPMTNKCSVSESCFLSSCCQTAEFQNTCPNRFERVRKGQRILNEKKDGAVCIILSGVGLGGLGLDSEEEAMQLSLVGKGHAFGITLPFAQDKLVTYVQALTDLEVCKISSQGLMHYTKQNPSILYNFMLAANSGIHNMMRQVWIKSPRKIYDRVLRALTVLNEIHGKDLTLSHDDLALIVGADRPTVTLALDKLQDEGLVSLEYRRVCLNTKLTSNELEYVLKPNYQRICLRPSLADKSAGHTRQRPDIHTSSSTTTF
jgi:CRP-like cAMP-binding protein